MELVLHTVVTLMKMVFQFTLPITYVAAISPLGASEI